MKEKTILFLCSWYPSKTNPFLGNFIQRHARAAALYHPIISLSTHEADAEEVNIHVEGNLTEVRVYYKRNLPFISQFLAFKKGLKTLSKRNLIFDLVHLHVLYPAAYHTLFTSKPLFISEHFSGYHPASGYQWNWLNKLVTVKALKKSQFVLPVSQHLGEAIKKFEASITLKKVSNVVDVELFKPIDSNNEVFTFLHISTLEERSKNITQLLEGFKALTKLHNNFKLQIGGDGDINALKQQVLSAKIPLQHIEFITERPSAEIAPLMQRADCFVLFSNFENQPCVILEALCCGVPVVSSAVGGIPEEIDVENGLLVPKNDVVAFTKALSEMIIKKNNYHKSTIAKKAKAKYSMQAIGQQLSELYLNELR